MENWKKDGRRDVVLVDLDVLVPANHLLRKIERGMDYEWLYERLSPYYCHDNGRNGTDPVVLVKMVLIQHLFDIPSLRQTYQRIKDTLSYRWFLGYSLLDEIPHFATVSYAFCKRFPPTRTVECSLRGEHERQFAYEAHTVCERHGFVLDVEVTAENVHDSVAWDAIYDRVSEKFDINFVTMDAGYKTPWIAKKVFEGEKLPILPYTRPKGSKEQYKPWEYQYNSENDTYACPQGGILRHTTTDRDGKRIYRSTPKHCVNCPHKKLCGANEKGQKALSRHIWQGYLDLAEQLRKTEWVRDIYAMRKQTIERVFGDAKEKHAMRYTQHRGLTRVTQWVRLKYAAMNLKKLATWAWNSPRFSRICLVWMPYIQRTAVFTT